MRNFVFTVLIGAVLVSACDQLEKKGEHLDEGYLLQSMSTFQRFSQKVWFAGHAQNWELAEFYNHELEEVTEEFIANKVFHDGRDLSSLALKLLEQPIESLDKAIDRKDEVLFFQNYKTLINSCNSCHASTGHDFIKITVPLLNPFNQSFTLKDSVNQ